MELNPAAIQYELHERKESKAQQQSDQSHDSDMWFSKLEKQMATFVYTTVFAFPVNKIASPSKMATMRSSIDLPCSIAWGEPSDFGMSATSVFSSRFSFWQFDSQNSALKQSKEASGAARMAPERVCASTFWIGRFAEVLQKPLSLNLLNISTLTLPQQLVRAVDEIEDMGVPAGLTIVPLLCLCGSKWTSRDPASKQTNSTSPADCTWSNPRLWTVGKVGKNIKAKDLTKTFEFCCTCKKKKQKKTPRCWRVLNIFGVCQFVNLKFHPICADPVLTSSFGRDKGSRRLLQLPNVWEKQSKKSSSNGKTSISSLSFAELCLSFAS